MSQDWRTYWVQHGASSTGMDFGDAAEELKAAQSASIVVPISDLALIRASGDDAASFLHNLLTNDVEHLKDDAVARCGFCTPKGRLLANFLIWKDGADLILALSADLHAAMLKKLSMYVLRAKVRLSDASGDFALLGASGPAAQQVLQSLDAQLTLPGAALQAVTSSAGQFLRLAEQRWLLAIPQESVAVTWQQLATQLKPAGLNAWHWLDIMAGLPWITEATREEFVPQMVNFELIGGISFKKGCYPGQEIVARTHYLGKVKRRMYRAHSEAAAVKPGMQVYSAESDQACGMVVNAAASPLGGHDLLVVLQTANSTGAAALHLDTPEGPLLVLQPLPYAV